MLRPSGWTGNLSDVILFVCDARTGITDEDAEVAKLLRKSRKPIVLAVNKADSFKQEMEIFEFYNLGLGEPIPISAANHLGLGDMLDSVMDKVQQTVPQLAGLTWENPLSSTHW